MNVLWFLPILSVMMFVHEFGHFVTARFFGITVLEFGFGLPPRVWGYKSKRNGIIYSINWIPFGAFVKMLGEEDPSAPGSFASKPIGTRAIVLAAGSAMNFLLAVLAFAMVYIVGVPGVTPDGPVKIAEVASASPAEAAGLQAGDVIVSFDGQPVTVQAFRDDTQAHLDQPVQIDYRRGDQTQSTTLTPRSNPPEGQGAIGIVITGGLIHLNPLTALGQGLVQTLRVIGATLSVPKMLLEGSIAPSDARLVGLVLREESDLDAAHFAESLKQRGVETRPFFLGMHEQPVLRERGLFAGEAYPVAERIARQVLYLPSGLALEDEHIQRVCEAVVEALRN